MEKHEKRCTNNPNRVCNLCNFCDGGAPLKELVAFVKKYIQSKQNDFGGKDFWSTDEESVVLAGLREMNNCPACILSALRQSGAPFLFQSFDFKKEKAALWDNVNVDEMGCNRN